MIAKADVVIENMAPGTFARLGFDWPRLHAINPRLIFAQVKGFAPESPHANYQRMTTGRGQHIQIAMRDAMLNYCRTPMSRQAAREDQLPRGGNGVVGT